MTGKIVRIHEQANNCVRRNYSKVNGIKCVSTLKIQQSIKRKYVVLIILYVAFNCFSLHHIEEVLRMEENMFEMFLGYMVW